jgi:hypothetical protein
MSIGQRYHVIVEAKPNLGEEENNGNYWIRTVPAKGCSDFQIPWSKDNATTGIVRYGFNDETPKSKPGKFPTDCSDEPYDKLKPILKWTVPQRTICESQS